MDKLENFFSTQRGDFNTEEPSPGHFERFRSKLENRQSDRKPNLLLVASAAAIAGIIVTASLSLLLSYSGIEMLNNNSYSSQSLTPEMVNVDEYYKTQVSKKQEVINMLMMNSNQVQNQEIAQTLIDLNQGYDNVLAEISSSPSKARAVHVLVLHYQTKLDVMEQIIDKLENVNHSK
ncbi:MAG TPA: hypothetical protein PL017_01720 [Tenuifilaceae bacterium]|nr:hypothetical protein [Tenuifilaceae bacterium]HPJ44785.1 hypothetical protein [Tenuifilaceae bacterium]HPQ33281.1 hypothetical protein [Tenuifilaceae bacterium]HRX67567.1 hypothetical protein [Tenuifilaceae bacterium]